MKLNALREQRSTKVASMKALVDKAAAESRDLSAEEIQQFDALKVEERTLAAQVERAEYLGDLERRSAGEPVSGNPSADFDRLAGSVSVVKVLKAQMEGRSLDGAEGEYAKEAEKRSGRKAEGAFVPFKSLEKRANTTVTAPELIGTDHRAQDYIGPLRESLVARALGVRVLSGLVGNVSIPKFGSGLETGWITEGQAVPEGQMTFDGVTLTPKHVGGKTEMSRQLLQQPELMGRSSVYRRAVVVPNTGSSYKVLSSEAFTKHGLSVSYAGCDELHAWPDRELYDVLVTSMGARRQPLTVITTTAGFDKQSLCYELWQYALQVRDGSVPDDSFLPVIYAADPDDDWTSPATWEKANPAFNVTVMEDFYAQECAKARALPSYENTFRRLYLNQWTESDSRWLSSDAWNACGGPVPDLTGRACYAGLDLATTTDIAALVLAFPDGPDMHLLPFFFVPQEAIHKRAKRDRVPYDLWVQQGHIIATPGAVIDYAVIRRTINELGELYQIKEIAFDRWNASQISVQLEGDGFELIGFGQGFASMSGPTKELETRVIGKTLRHGDNPVLNWMAANVTVEGDAAGNAKPSKKKSTEKIDGIVASIMAIGRAMVASDQPVETEVYFV